MTLYEPFDSDDPQTLGRELEIEDLQSKLEEVKQFLMKIRKQCPCEGKSEDGKYWVESDHPQYSGRYYPCSWSCREAFKLLSKL